MSRASEAGIFNAIRGTFWIGIFTVASFPIGIAAAVYLEEYARHGRFTNFVNVNIRNLVRRAVGGLRDLRAVDPRRALRRRHRRRAR